MERSFIIIGALAISGVAVALSRAGGRYAVPYRDEYQRAEAGYTHYLELRGGSLYAAGANGSGQLGTGDLLPSAEAVHVGDATNWVLVSAGEAFSLGLRADGSLWAWGANGHGQLGTDNSVGQDTPQQVGAERWVSISAGAAHALAIRADGSLWAWGSNDNGQLGLGDAEDVLVPTQVGTDRDWASVSGGEKHSIALKANGSLWAWGHNILGQVGSGSTSFDPVLEPTRIGTANDWKHADAGGYFSTAVKADGSLWVWGDDYYGQVTGTEGMPVATPTRIGTANNWLRTFSGRYHITALKADGTVWAWGKNENGELGTGSGQPTAPVAIDALRGTVQLSGGDGFSLALRSGGDLHAWGTSTVLLSGELSAAPILLSQLREVVSTSSRHGFVSLVLYTDGTLKGWGYNAEYGLADGTTDDKYVPIDLVNAGANNISISAGFGHVLALHDNGTLWGWGDNDTYGQVGTGSGQQETVPVQVGTWNDWISAVSGSHHSTGIRADGTLWAWGPNYDGELGTGDETPHHTPIQVGTDHDWVSVIGGASHTIALKANGTIWGWGANYSGDAGGPEEVDPLFAITRIGEASDWIAVNAHTNTSLALNARGELHAWGAGYSGQIPGNAEAQYGPLLIGEGYVRGELGSWSGVGLKADGSLDAWGGLNMVFGELGMGDMENRLVPTPVPGQVDVVQISSGQCHKMLVHAEREAICTVGRNANGELGVNSEELGMNAYQCVVANPTEAVVAMDITVSTVGGVPATTETNTTLSLQAHVLPFAAPQDVQWSITPVTGTASITADGTLTGLTTGTVYAKAIATGQPTISDSLLVTIASGGGLDEVQRASLSVYPSPADDHLFVRAGSEAIDRISVVDHVGRTVITERANTAELLTVDVSALPAGAYVVQLHYRNGERRTATFLKR